MSTTRHHALAATLLSATLAAGCAGEPDTDRSEVDLPAAGAQPGSGAALRVEQAARQLDLGGDVRQARATLEAAASDPAATPEERDEARLELSRALEIEGDGEGAIAAVEALLAGHAGGGAWPAEARAEARLRKLLTGSATEPRQWPRADPRPLAPFARVLSRYFPLESRGGRGVAEVRLLAFGGNDEDTRRIGAFDVDRALRELQREKCPLCEGEPSIQTSRSRSGSWVGIPRHRASLGASLAVFYVTLGDGLIPARYDADLPLPAASILAHLEKGKGLLVAREREGAPPSIVIAAPREAQLAQVEEALAEMDSLPTLPVTMSLTSHLSAGEIQSVVRAGFGRFRACYEALLSSNPTASGNVALKFAIQPDGSVSGTSINSATGALTDADLQQCMISAMNRFVFPEALDKTDVVYPILMTPGDDAP